MPDSNPGLLPQKSVAVFAVLTFRYNRDTDLPPCTRVHAVQHLILQANRQMEDDEIERIAMDVFQFFPALQHLKSLFGEIFNS